MIALLNTPLDTAKALQAFESKAAGAGAIVSFTGLVRPSIDDEQVQSLHLQAYSPLTERGMQAAARAAQERWSLTALTMQHRIGNMAPGEPIVFVATASRHRRAAFEAADYLMDYLKTEAVFWKKEITSSGEHWVEPRPEDHADQARWSDAGE